MRVSVVSPGESRSADSLITSRSDSAIDRVVVVPEYRPVDWLLLLLICSLAAGGLVMVYSASIAQADRVLDNPFFYSRNQMLYLSLGAIAGLFVWNVPLRVWERYGPHLLGVGLLLLLVVLLFGKTVNGSTRWLQFGITFQPSEFFKIAMIVYLAGFIVRKGAQIRTAVSVFLTPLVVAGIAGVLLILEPDFGATVVIILTTMAMLFIAGVRFVHFFLVLMCLLPLAIGAIMMSPYRKARLFSFMQPWDDPFATDFQLTQSLIAIGRGSVTGTGLGNSIQKMAYLPEAHTDFVFAVMAEETGFIGVCVVVALFSALVFRCFQIGRKAETAGQMFGAHVAFGIGFWFGLQAFINIGANMGVLPTKGITLPLFSYGGSSVLIVCIACGLLLRIHREYATHEARESRRMVEARLYGGAGDYLHG